MKLTPWFDKHTKPVHVGVYLRQYRATNQFRYNYWDGKAWHINSDNPQKAEAAKGTSKWTHQTLPWRGLAEQPK